jgi:hypothetical protein
VKVGNQPTSAAWQARSRKLLPVQHTVLKPSCPAAEITTWALFLLNLTDQIALGGLHQMC